MSGQEDRLKAFITRQKQLLQSERDAEIERSSLLLSNCGPKLLEQKGLALNGLGVASINIGLGGKTLVELERPTAYHTSPIFPPHTFRNGDLARIEAHVASSSSNGPPKKTKKTATSSSASTGDVTSNSAEGVVYKVSDTRIVIAIDPANTSDSGLDLPERCRVVKLANSVTYDRMDKAIERLERTVLPSADGKPPPPDYVLTPLMQVLMCMKPLGPPAQRGGVEFFDPNLNDSQKEAVRFCLAAPEVACIHGPPGTGKTHTLIELIRQLTKPTPTHPNGRRLLVCGASNLSVDNILERLLDLPSTSSSKPLKVTRIGHPARVMAHEGILDSTLDAKSTRTDQAALVKDIKQELEGYLNVLTGKGGGKAAKGTAAAANASKGGRPRGAERKKMWEEVKALRKEFRQRESTIVHSVLAESQVVLATCHSAGGRQMRNEEFDVVIIDEATQAMEAVCWVPIFKAKKLILAGDPMQLPPTVLSLDEERKKSKKADGEKVPVVKKGKDASAKVKKGGKKEQAVVKEDDEGSAEGPPDSEDEEEGSEIGDDSEIDDEEEDTPKQASKDPKRKRQERKVELTPPRSLEVTLFERLEKMYGRKVKRMLTVQYRMHKQICDFPSTTLYRSKLISHDSVKEHLLKDLVTSTSEDEEEVLQHPVVFFDTSGCEYFERLDTGGEDINLKGKAAKVEEGSRCNENEASVVRSWVEKLVENGVEPGQMAIITPYQAQVTLLTSMLRPVYGPSLEIGTVDGMQGREKEAVVISLVRSNDKREVGFLKEKRRMNVAMTRARRHLCVVGDSSTVTHGGKYLKKWVAWLEANADVRFPDV